MKKLSIDQMETIEGGCIEYAMAWAEATWAFMEAETTAGAAYWSAVAVYSMNQWNNCTYQ